MKWLLVPLTIFIASCGVMTTPIELVNLTTGEKAVCGPYGDAGTRMAAVLQEAQCLNDYRERGYVRK